MTETEVMGDIPNKKGKKVKKAESESDEEQKCLVDGNEGWANVFEKLLTQNPKVKKRAKGKALILAKAKKDTDRSETKADVKEKKVKREPMKIVDDEGNVVDEEELTSSEESESESEDVEKLSRKDLLDKVRQKKLRKEMGLVIPQPGDPYEKMLIRTATKGVVQLFNAVNKFQADKKSKRRDDDSSDEEDRRYKKGKFMEDLNKASKKGEKSSRWEALRDDFMMDSKMKDWDKKESEDEDE